MKKAIPLFLLTFVFATSNEIKAQNKANNVMNRPGKTELSVPVEDSVLLGTTVFLPRGKKKCPTVLVRTPYNRTTEEWMGKAFSHFGIAVVLQDVRGRYQSEGGFYPFIHERSDGLQTLRWIRDQSWSDGTIAGYGGSYLGYTQWAVSDSLDFMTLLLTGANLYELCYPDGLFSLQTTFAWGLANGSREAKYIPPEKLRTGALILPLSAADDSIIQDITFINDWIKHEEYDSYWEKTNHRGMSRSPALSMAGWYDIFLKSQILDFQKLVEQGSTGSRLIIGPWCHGTMGEKNEYGGLKKTGKPMQIFWYVKNHLKGKTGKLSAPLKDSRYNLFIMERNEYVGSEVWPPRETHTVPYYIGPSGYLSTSAYKEDGHLTYRYSPADPYPSLGGTALGEGVGPVRQNRNAGRKDQLVFEITITEPLILLGPISATLFLSSDAPCTDFIVGLQDVFPDGKIINIQEGGAKVSANRDIPGKTEISVWATGYQLNAGHRLRMFIASSWFPRYNRSLNTCDPTFNAVNPVPAIQKIFYGPKAPSSINLPVYTIQVK